MKITLINPYELGRQPFGLAEPAALLAREGCAVSCCDLSIQKLDECLEADTELVCIYVPMHTATRIAVEALPKIRQLEKNNPLLLKRLVACPMTKLIKWCRMPRYMRMKTASSKNWLLHGIKQMA